MSEGAKGGEARRDEEPAWRGRGEALATIARADRPDDACRALIALALHDHDGAVIEAACLDVLRNSRDIDLRRCALTGIGHSARRFGAIHLRDVVRAAEALEADPELGGTAGDALSDIRMFARRTARGE